MIIAMTLSALSIAFTLPDSCKVTAPSAAKNGIIASTRIDLEPSNPFHDSKFMYSKPRPNPVPKPTVKGPLRNK
ncbi:MAG: hypothetical protein ABI036_16145 [Fibrobacteria bacterium]